MAKTKKIPKSNEEEKQEDKPGRIFKNGFKARQALAPVSEMMVKTLNALRNEKGVPLAAIRNYIRKNYNNNKKVGKETQQRIKDYISEKFVQGEIKMVNCDQAEINFTMRFMVVDDAAAGDE